MNFYDFNKTIQTFIETPDFFENLINFSMTNLNISSIKILYCFDNNYTVFSYSSTFEFLDINKTKFTEEVNKKYKNSISQSYFNENSLIAKVILSYEDNDSLDIKKEELYLDAITFSIEKYDCRLGRFFNNFSKASTFFFQKLANPAIILDNKKRLVLKNKSVGKLVGSQYKIYSLTDLLNLAVNRDVVKNIRNAIDDEREWKGILWIKKNDSNVFPQEISIYLKKDHNNKTLFYYIVFNDLTTQNKVEKELIYYANYDFLTALPNRKGFNEKVCELINRKINFSLILIDLDKFKFINEHYGHPSGDELLITFSSRLKQILSAKVFKCRLSGDEFVLIFENISDEDIRYNLNLIFESFSKAIVINNTNHFLTLSAGITKYPDFGSSLSSLISSSEYALKKSKKIEGNSYIFYNQHLKEEHLRKLSIIQKLKTAIINEEFEVNYQPIYNNKNKILKAEALVRWKDFEGNNIPPCIFIPIAEETGLIKHISIIVGKRVIEDMKVLYDEGHKNFQISVNVSLKDFEEKYFNKINILDSLIENKRYSKNIIVEVTESLFMKENINYIDQLVRLKNLGFTIALDDFGTGYSSLSYLTKLPIDIIKIDRSFVSSLENEKSSELVKIIIHMAKVLNLQVVAEGVEEKWHMDYLDYLDCDFFQGFYLKKPVNFKKLHDLLKADLKGDA